MNKSVNTLRLLGVDMIQRANSGHPGIVLGAAPIMYALDKAMRFNPNKPEWFNRDRFVMAAGHGSALLYANLHLCDYGLTIDDLKKFRQMDSKTPGHPEYKHTKGIDATSGPLGQGIAMATGMAIAETFLAAKFNKGFYNVVDHYTYVLCGDGDLQEGVTQEAMSLAGHLGLSKLVVVYDSNDIQLDGSVDMTNTENVKNKYEAMNWDYIRVNDGNNQEELSKALNSAKATLKPTIIEVKTKIGYGSPLEGKSDSHGAPLGQAGIEQLKVNLGYDEPAFIVSNDVYADFRENIIQPNKEAYKEWEKMFKEYSKEHKELARELEMIIDGDYNSISYPVYPVGTDEATRITGGNLINLLSSHVPHLIGGSADLTKSTKAKGANGDYGIDNRTGRNINFGVREHAMAAIVNGLTLSGLRGFSGGFFVFSDYMKPAIRMAALMRIPSIFVFTHDSLGVGEDGPTHQPVEQLTGLRAIPNLNVLRPGNANEVSHAFKRAIESTETPTVIVLSRQNIKTLNETSYEDFTKGAYIAAAETSELQTVILATGSELELAHQLKGAMGSGTRVVSITSFHDLNRQRDEYIQKIIPRNVRRIAIEMATATEFYKYADTVIGVEDFGMSAPSDEVIKKYGFTVEDILNKI